MTVRQLREASDDLEQAFDYYESRQHGLGDDLLTEYRRGIDLMLRHPNAWQPLDDTFRQYRIHRFPYGIVYHVSEATDEIVIVAFSHLSRAPGWWRERT